MSRWNLRLAKLSTGLLALGLASGVANAQQATTPKPGGTLVVVTSGDPSGINPNITTAGPELLVACYIYEGLVVFNNNTNKFEPLLAESWTISPDGLTYNFKLRKTNWHDGTPLTSEDVRFSLMDVAAKMAPTYSAQAGKVVESITTPDPQTVEIKLKEPYGPLLRVLTCSNGAAVLPAHLFKGTDIRNNPVTQKPVGTGPFKFSDWKRADHIALVKNDKYWQPGKPYLDNVVVRIMPNAASRTQALIAGEVDYIGFTTFPPNDAKTVDANPNLKRVLNNLPNMLYVFFNLKRKPFDDVKVRHALLQATDRNYIFTNAFFGSGKPGTAPWAVQIPWAANPDVSYDKSDPYNPEAAAKLLDEAGLKPDANGVRLKLTLIYDPAASERTQTALALQAMWKRVGVEVTPLPLESAVILPRAHQEANFDVYMSSYTSFGDPGIGVGRAFISSTIGGIFGNASGYSNPEIDALFAKATALTTLEERGAVYKQIMPILVRDLPAFTLHENRGADAATKRLEGGWGWVGGLNIANTWLEK